MWALALRVLPPARLALRLLRELSPPLAGWCPSWFRGCVIGITDGKRNREKF
jgi:hypothetical protein